MRLPFLTPGVVALVAALQVRAAAAAGALVPRLGQSSTIAYHYYGNFSFSPAGFVLEGTFDIGDVNRGYVECPSGTNAGNCDLNDRSLLDKQVADCPASITALCAPRCSHLSTTNLRSCGTVSSGENNCTSDNSVCSHDVRVTSLLAFDLG
ncbi:hypothetical protein HMN09_01171300 [Mycena chlorophos]|uniref:Uncharacterized protein n=1 Tax=Mycena chlorophos TaxID=658473 RepID=A0A8H6S7S9_MYCCL|nr:hypothetical protein HMN09_01171300 [Mycena chlorophos]